MFDELDPCLAVAFLQLDESRRSGSGTLNCERVCLADGPPRSCAWAEKGFNRPPTRLRNVNHAMNTKILWHRTTQHRQSFPDPYVWSFRLLVTA